MIALVDYGTGNLRSIINAAAEAGRNVAITASPEAVAAAEAVILPGVGAVPGIVHQLRASGLIDVVRQSILTGKPVLAICAGLQLLFASTEEGGKHECLGLLAGEVRRLPGSVKVPHMGWNQVRQQVAHPIFEGIPDGADFYFVHSYYAVVSDAGLVAGTTDYGAHIPSVVAWRNLVATQFHPEKSGANGLKLYANFFRSVAAGSPA